MYNCIQGRKPACASLRASTSKKNVARCIFPQALVTADTSIPKELACIDDNENTITTLRMHVAIEHHTEVGILD